MKITTSRMNVIDATGFPFDYNNWNYPEEILRQYLFCPDDPNLFRDDDRCLVMDYDGFVKWFPEWNRMYKDEADADWYKDDQGGKYLSENVGRTVSVVRLTMTPVVFINCTIEPYVDDIICHLKQYETRTRNTLDSLVGIRVLLAETGHGNPLVKCSAVIDQVVSVYTREQWEEYLEQTWIPVGSMHDWQPNTKVKYLYHLTDVQRVAPFSLPKSCHRHGRVWAEYREEEV